MGDECNLVNKNWLPHLTNEMMIGARNNNLCSYLIALEGWRRGLKLTWYSDKVKKRGVHAPGRLFSLSNKDREHTFYKSKGDKVTQEAIRIGSDKGLTKERLSKAGISVPNGSFFTKEDTHEDIISYSKQLEYPLVLKPATGNQGNGVIANIENEEALSDALTYLKTECGFENLILERFIPGQEYRFFIIENKVIAVLHRIPANVIGDGVHTISQLISLKNKERKKNPRLYSCLIKKDYEIKRLIDKGLFTLDSIPKKGEQIFLSEKSNISTGGDSLDVTEEMPYEIKQIAIDALKAVPGLPHGGLDMIVDLEAKTAAVLEINPIPQIGSLVFPMEGKARDIPSALIDYYFPETSNKEGYNGSIYFDFKSTLQPLINKSAKEVVVISAPLMEYAKKYIIKGKVQGVNYRRWIRNRALESDLFGFTKNEANGDVTVVVAGSKKAVNDFKFTCEIGPSEAVVTSVTETAWKRPIKACFEIKEQPFQKKKMSKSNHQKKQRMSIIKKHMRKIKTIKQQ